MNVISTNSAIQKRDAETQFEELIVKPSGNVATIEAVVIIVDALDESGERNERNEFGTTPGQMHRASEELSVMLPLALDRTQVEAWFQNYNILCKRMGNIDAEETCLDIQAHFSNCLAPISPIFNKIDRDWGNILAKRAEGLFQWAQTVCQSIDPTVARPQLVKKNWETCVSSSSFTLFELYRHHI